MKRLSVKKKSTSVLSHHDDIVHGFHLSGDGCIQMPLMVYRNICEHPRENSMFQLCFALSATRVCAVSSEQAVVRVV